MVTSGNNTNKEKEKQRKTKVEFEELRDCENDRKKEAILRKWRAQISNVSCCFWHIGGEREFS